MGRTRTKWAAAITIVVGLVGGAGQPAGAVHLFPLTPTFDPLGHDCAKKLAPNPGGSAGAVQVVGFNFIDGTSRTSTTRVKAGQAVTWTWGLDHCHSVTFAPGGPAGTAGDAGFMPAGQPQLVRLSGAANSFTATFPDAGTFSYSCVHHASVGMTGAVVVEPAAAAPATSPPGGAPAGGSGGGSADVAPPQQAAPADPAPSQKAAPRTLPVSGAPLPFVGLSPLLLAAVLVSRRLGLAGRWRTSGRPMDRRGSARN